MKVFFDTNVYVAEALLGQAAEQLIEATERAAWRIYATSYGFGGHHSSGDTICNSPSSGDTICNSPGSGDTICNSPATGPDLGMVSPDPLAP